MAKSVAKSVEVRQVWASNLHKEFRLINEAILRGFCFAAIDTEFPGTIFDPPQKRAYSSLLPHEYYSIMKQNVDELQIIQLGLTLVSSQQDLPDLNFSSCYVWQFNFSDFDREIHPHNKDSISLLEKQGMDFSKNKSDGINSLDFACQFQEWVLSHNLTWITFQGSYDFAFLIKILTGELPCDVGGFMEFVSTKFGGAAYDVKLIARFLGYHGGLEKVGKSLGLTRLIGKSHQAGSDSLYTMRAYLKLFNKWYYTCECFIGLFYGLSGVKGTIKYQKKLNCS